MAVPKVNELMEKLVSLCKRRGFIYPSSEIYGGLAGFWDYGPLGAELKRQVKELWWRQMVHEREDVVGLEASILMAPRVWEASGHVATFSDPMVDCKTCQGRFRADQLEEIPCPQKPSRTVSQCAGEKTEPRPFNLMFETQVGPVRDAGSVAYLRPETAQAIFVQFKNVLETSRQRVPFGIAQVGKAFRNEVTPRNYTFRSREFEQMELEYFIRPDEVVEAICGRVARVEEGSWAGEPQADWGWEVWHKYWVEQRLRFYEGLGLPRGCLKEYWQRAEELAHYARATVDILYTFPFSKRDAQGELVGEELEGIAARGDFDLSQHQRYSGKALTVYDEELKGAWGKLAEERREALWRRYYEARREYHLRMAGEAQEREGAGERARAEADGLGRGWYVPHVIEPSAGVDRLVLALLAQGYGEDEAPNEKGELEKRVVLRLHPRVAPIKVAVFPLLKNRPELVRQARAVGGLLRPWMTVFYDEAGAIGRRYRRQDEAGTPFGVTIDFETLGEKGPELAETVTVRERDSMRQERVRIAELVDYLLPRVR